jgi:hypothetical protein
VKTDEEFAAERKAARDEQANKLLKNRAEKKPPRPRKAKEPQPVAPADNGQPQPEGLLPEVFPANSEPSATVAEPGTGKPPSPALRKPPVPREAKG